MFRKVTKFSKRIIYVVLMLLCFQLFLVGYVFSLVIVKPRDVTNLFLSLSKHLSSDRQINIDSERITLSWNRSEFSFDINFLGNYIQTSSHSFIVPHLVVDVSKRNLFLWKFEIDKIKIPRLNYAFDSYQLDTQDRSNIITSDQISNFLSNEAVNILDSSFQKLSYLRNIEIDELAIILPNKSKYIIDGFRLRQRRKIRENKVEVGFDYTSDGKERLEFRSECVLDRGHKFRNCDVEVNNISDNIWVLFKNYLPDILVKRADLQFNINRMGNNYEINSTIKVRDFNYKTDKQNLSYDDFGVNATIIVNKNFLTVSKLLLESNKKKLLFESQYGLKDKGFVFKLSGENIDKSEALVLWPEKIAKGVKGWLKRSLRKSELSSFYISSDLSFLKQKVKVKSLQGEFNFENTDLKFVKFLQPVERSSGRVELINKRLDIKIDKGYVAGNEISNFHAFIPMLKKGESVLNINGALNIGGRGIIDFLLSESLSRKQLRLLYRLFGEIKADLELALQLNLRKPFTNRDFKLDVSGGIRDMKYLFDDKSKAGIFVKKSFGDDKFDVKLDFADSKIYVPWINYQKDLGEELMSNMKIYKTGDSTMFDDVTLDGGKEYLRSNFSFSGKGLSSLEIIEAKLDKNDFTLDYYTEGGQKYFILNSENVELRPVNFTNMGGKKKSNPKDLVLDLNVKKLNFANENKFYDVKSKYICTDQCNFFYAQARMGSDEGVFFKYFLNQENVPKLVLETNNLGYVIDSIGISDKLDKGKLHFAAEQKDGRFQGDILVSNFYVKKVKFFKKLSELDILRNKNLENKDDLLFEKGGAQISFDNKNLEIKDTVFYGKLFGITTEGRVFFHNNTIDLNGVIVPSYKINNLLGIKDIPVIGKLITGGKNKGLLSAGYEVKGSFKDMNFSFNPLTVALPSFLRSIVDLLSFQKGDQDINNK